MADKTSELVLKIRDRMTERAMSGAPYWTAPVVSSAQSTAGCLLVGTLVGKLPNEDAVALCETLAEEQNADGSWSYRPDEPGDLSLTLEVVEALSEARHPNGLECLEAAIDWLESHRERKHIGFETLCLLRALTDVPKSQLERWLGPLGKWIVRKQQLRADGYATRPALRRALEILALTRADALGRSRVLLEMQYVDGSWDGGVRSTVLAMVALRHTGFSFEDAAYERGWRYLLANQAWRGDALVQNPHDSSNLLHAAAVRTLIMTGADPDLVATSILTLLHQQRTSGGWAAGGLLPTDLFTTAVALDALSFAGDIPVETTWARRRAALLLARAQHGDGGWPLLQCTPRKALRLRRIPFLERTRPDVTALAVQALTYAGVAEPELDHAIENGVRYLLRTQSQDGLWRGERRGLDVFTTSHAVEALLGAAPDKSRAALTGAVRALLRRQREDGSWRTAHDSAWALRALAGMPGVPADVMKRGRTSLELAADHNELLWRVDGAGMPLPPGEIQPVASDLTTLWALEALAPLGAAARTQRAAGKKSRSIPNRRL